MVAYQELLPMANLLGHVGYLLLFYGQYQLTDGNPDGWLYRLAGECIWLGLGIHLKMNSIWLWGVAGALIELMGYAKWVAS